MLPKIYLICQNIRSLHNVGSIFRSADAFAVDKIYLCGYTGAPPHPDISKTALGGELTVSWERRAQTYRVIEELKNRGAVILALELAKNSRPITVLGKNSVTKKSSDRDISWYRDLARKMNKNGVGLIVGNEVKGITQEMLGRADAVVHIPMHGKKESLNVAVAAGIALYHLRNLC